MIIRILNILAVICVGAMAAQLYHTKYEIERLEQRQGMLHKIIKDERETLQVLKAEWSYLSRPERIQRLAQKYLELSPLHSRQMIDPDHLSLTLERIPFKQGRALEEATRFSSQGDKIDWLFQLILPPPEGPLPTEGLKKKGGNENRDENREGFFTDNEKRG